MSSDHLARLDELIADAADLLGGFPRDARSPLDERAAKLAIRHSETRRVSPAPARLAVTPAGTAPVDERPTDAPPSDGATREERHVALARLEEEVRQCARCPLHLGRANTVPGEGVLDPLVMFVGEGPGAEEDRTGHPFVGRAGAFLDQWLAAIDLRRGENVFIANIVKCRPPENRDPLPNESQACTPYLDRQIEIVRPRIIVTLGSVAARRLTGSMTGITRIHGTLFTYRGTPVIPTFHPAGVLRNEAWKRPVWEDLKRVRAWLNDHT